MTPGALTGIVIIGVAMLAMIAAVGVAATRHWQLKRRFGNEYDRLVGARGAKDRRGKIKAEAELAARVRRVQGLRIRQLAINERRSYASQWERAAEGFVDEPAKAVAAAQELVMAVLRARGYPTDSPEQQEADLSVEHARVLNGYRAARQASAAAKAGTASTEDLRKAMLGYRALFAELIGEPLRALESPAFHGKPQPDVETGSAGARRRGRGGDGDEAVPLSASTGGSRL